MKPFSFAFAAPLLLLIGCADTPPASQGTTTAAPSAAQPATSQAAAQAPGTPSAIDGTYTFSLRLLAATMGGCQSGADGRQMTVRNGSFSFPYSPSVTITGKVGADGAVNATGPSSGNAGPTTLDGKIAGGKLTGTTKNLNCTYTVSGQR